MALQSIAGLEPGWQMAACLQGLDSYRASNTANTDNWVEKDAARTQIFIVSLCVSLNWFHVFFLTFGSHLPDLASFKVFPTSLSYAL